MLSMRVCDSLQLVLNQTIVSSPNDVEFAIEAIPEPYFLI
jgi:hypothetical protein